MKNWGFRLNIKNIAIILFGTLINIVGRSLAEYFNLPVWLDSVGTFTSAVILGPIAGAVSGALMNLITAISDPQQIFFSIVSISGGIAVGRFFPRDRKLDSFSVIATALIAGLIMTVISTPLNLYFNGGYTGNMWGDALVDMLADYVNVKTIRCIAGELLVNMPDKVVCIVIALFVYHEVKKHQDSREEEKGEDESTVIKMVTLILLSTVMTATVFHAERVFASEKEGTYKEEDPVKDQTLIQAEKSGTIDIQAGTAAFVYGVDNGLVSMEMNTVEQTSDGYVWAGSYSGLYRYNGHSFEQMRIDDDINNVIYLFDDSKNRLWIGTNDCGAACYDYSKGVIDFYTVEDGLSSDSIRSVCEDEEGNIYISTTMELCRIDKSGEVHAYTDIPEVTCVYSLNYLGNGFISGVTQDGLLFVIKDDRLVFSLSSDEVNVPFTAVAGGEEGDILAGTSSDMLYRFHLNEDGSLDPVSSFQVPEINYVNFIKYTPDAKGYLVAASVGLAFVDMEDKASILTREDFGNAITDIMIDYQDNLWFSSSKQGILKLSENPFFDMFKKAGMGADVVNSLLIDGDILYIGMDKGLGMIDTRTGMPENDKSLTDKFEGVRIRHLMKDKNGNIWVSTYGRDGLVCVFPDGKFADYNADTPGVLGSRFRFTLELSDGRILAASTDGLNYIENGRVIQTMGVDDGLKVPQILFAIEKNDGTILAGSDGDGIYVIENGRITGNIGTKDGLNSLVILRIVPCEKGFLYVTSNGIYFDGDGEKVRRLTAFPYNNNYDIRISRKNEAWVSSSAGIYIVDIDKLIEDGEYDHVLLNRSRGFNTTLTANAWNEAAGDELYLCCTDGVLRINTDTYNDLNEDYNIVISSMTVDDIPVPFENDVFMLTSGKGRVQILPAVLNYAASNPLISVYVEGTDDPGMTMHQSDMTGLYFTTLPFGDYRLHINVLDELSGEIKKEKIFELHKEAELYEHLYYKLYLIFVGGMLVAFLAWLFAKMSNMAVIERQYDEIREAKEEAEYANKAKSRFLANMSHEIRTPINAVLGMDEMILRESSEPEIRGYASDIYNAGNTLLSLINDILDSSKIESGKMEIVPVNYELATLIRDLVNMISQRAAAKDIKLLVEADKNLPKGLYGDDVRIRQVITNILTNAVKYTPEGTVWFRISGHREDDEAVIRFEVEDTGIGIKEEDLPRLFEAYQRIEEGRNRNIEGTGLGMNITLQLLHMMGSRLEVESEYGKGSRFYFDIRQKITDPEEIGDFDSSRQAPEEGYHHEGAFIAPDAKLLVVDDNAMNRKVISSLLKMTKIQVTEAGGGQEALDLASKERFDMVFMDHMMPDMDGVETMKRMKELEGYGEVPVYVLTANAVTGAKEQYLEAGFDGFVSKPVVSERLESAIREALPGELIRPMEEEDGLHNINGAGNKKGSKECGELPVIDGVDWDYALLHLPDINLVMDTVKGFYEVLKLQAEKLDEMWKKISAEESSGRDDATDLNSSFDAYRIQVHGMKSAAATIGIVPLAGMAKMLEFAARDKDFDTIALMHGLFLNEWLSYDEKLRELFGTESGEDKPLADPDMIFAMMDMLDQALEDFDVDQADEIMDKMRSYSYPIGVEELLPALSAAVKDLDQDEAERVFEGIRNAIET